MYVSFHVTSVSSESTIFVGILNEPIIPEEYAPYVACALDLELIDDDDNEIDIPDREGRPAVKMDCGHSCNRPLPWNGRGFR